MLFLQKMRHRHLSAAQLILLSFVGLIFLGTVLLNLPIASKSGMRVGFLNAWFTATSASCVTGLVVVDTASHWTLFGQWVILGLIQFGALGFISIFTASLLLFDQRLTLENRLVVQTAFNQDRIGGMGYFIRQVVTITLAIESVGALLLALGFHYRQSITWGRALYQGIFHAVAAFCNAGFDILGSASLSGFNQNAWIILVLSLLIILGGLGFPVIIELVQKIRRHHQWPWRRRLAMLSLHSKIVLVMTAALLITATSFFALLEWHNAGTLGKLPVGGKLLNSFFQAVTLRTAGFYTISQQQLTDLSKLLSSLLMLIGGSPAGTSGGIKTVTLAVILIAVHSALQGREQIVGFHRSLSLSLLQRALTVFIAFLLLALAAVVLFDLHRAQFRV